jgi:hypothetical protein
MVVYKLSPLTSLHPQIYRKKKEDYFSNPTKLSTGESMMNRTEFTLYYIIAFKMKN